MTPQTQANSLVPVSLLGASRRMPAAFSKRTLIWAVASFLALVLAVCVWTRDPAALRRVSVPEGGICPDVALSSGHLLLAYGKNRAIYCTKSADDGRTFSDPVRVSDPSSLATLGHERGPKLVVGAGGAIHIVWLGSRGNEVFYSRSTDGGQHFIPPRNLVPDGSGVDGASVAADQTGEVDVVWLGGGEGKESPLSSRIQLAYSGDDGATFAPPRAVASNYPGGACACCSLKAIFGEGHELYIGFRGAYQTIRDIYLLRGSARTGRFEASLVSNDQWQLEACPMNGPYLQRLTRPGEILVSWMSRGTVYRAVSSNGGRTFSPRVAPAEPQHGPREFPVALANSQNEILFAWVEKGSVFWERISPSGQIQQAGENRSLPQSSKPVAFVDRQGNFSLVY